MSVIIFIMSLKKRRYKKEIIKDVKKLNCIEFFTTFKNEVLFLLPIVKPTIPYVEKA